MRIVNLLFILFTVIVFAACTDEKKAEADKFFHSGEQKIIARDFAGAEADFTQAIALDPERYTPYHGRGEVRILLGKKDEGLQDLAKAMQLMEANHNLNDPQYKAAYDGIQAKYKATGGQ